MIKVKYSINPIECQGTNIYLLNDFLDVDQCESIISKMNWFVDAQVIVQSNEISKMLWRFIEKGFSGRQFDDRLRGKIFSVIGITNHITISKNYFAIGRHKDNSPDNCQFKIGFYLNELSPVSGTNFYENGEKSLSVGGKMGSGILFDISLEHDSQKIQYGKIKYMVGARPVIKYL